MLINLIASLCTRATVSNLKGTIVASAMLKASFVIRVRALRLIFDVLVIQISAIAACMMELGHIGQ